MDDLTNLLEFSFIDIPEQVSREEEFEESLPAHERQRRQQERQRAEVTRRQAALAAALAGQGVVQGAPAGFDPTPYQQHLAQQQQQQQQQYQQQQQQQQ